MLRRAAPLLPLLVLFLLLASVLRVRPNVKRSGLPDVFLITVDTLRADRLSAYGYNRIRTPAIESLAKAGVLFESCQATASWTLPSVASLMTSLYPSQLGLLQPGTGRPYPWYKKRKQSSASFAGADSLASILQGAGYHTVAFVDQPVISHRIDFRKGFDEWHFPVSPTNLATDRAGAGARHQGWPSIAFATDCDELLVRRFERLLAERNRSKSLFAWIHLLAPHRPYLPSPSHTPNLKEGESSDSVLSNLYDSEVLDLDEMLDCLLRAIATSSDLGGSVVVFTADHGEEFRDHGRMEHGHSLHREVLRVPLVITAPGLPRGKVVRQPVALIDLLPTILDLSGLSSQASRNGQSLLPLIGETPLGEDIYAEGMLYGPDRQALIHCGYKLIRTSGKPSRLFDLARDPDETNDLARAKPLLREEMEGRLTAFQQKLQSIPTTAAPSTEKDDEPSTRKALQALGYTDR